MNGKISRCNICEQFFDSKKELKEHKHRNHRITDSKIIELKGVIILLLVTSYCSLSELLTTASAIS